jgi:pimeloyl-ACP methyl ester carboxylesterase
MIAAAAEVLFPEAAALIAEVEADSTRHETPCGDGTLVWRVWGSGAGTPVILLHGGSGSWMHWVRTIPDVAEAREVWVPDLPGLGDSAMPPPPLTPHTCGEVVAEGIRRLFPPDRRPDLVTFSFGAHVGSFAAAALGPRLRSFTISGCAALGLPHRRADFARDIPGMSRAERIAVHRANLTMLMFADPARIDDLAIHIQAVNIAKARFRSRAFAATDEIRRLLPHIRVPLRAIWGERDQIALPSVEARFDVLREHHPELVTRIVPDAGHWTAYEQAEMFNAALLELLALPDL